MTDYASRVATAHSDGTPTFCSDLDKYNESDVKHILEKKWGCTLHDVGLMHPIDWYAVRDGRVVAWVELKSRSHARSKYPTVFLNFRKWWALLCHQQTGAPGIWVVRFTDGIYFVRVDDISPNRLRIGGTTTRVKSQTDIEPLIDVPIDVLTRV